MLANIPICYELQYIRLLLPLFKEVSAGVFFQHTGIISNKRGVHAMLEFYKLSKPLGRD
jgi:hypothetical protein